MAKSSEELNVLKEEFETLNKKLNELSKDELQQVTGGEEPRKPRKKKRPPIQGCSSIEI